MNRLINFLYATDCWLFSVCTLGGAYPSESFSSSAYRAELLGKFWRYARKPIDAVFGAGHCERAYFQAKLNLPEDQR